MKKDELINILNSSKNCKMKLVNSLYQASNFFNEKDMIFYQDDYEKNITFLNNYILRLNLKD